MENNALHAGSSTNHGAELRLLGIDKTWVRSPKGGWIDKAKLALPKKSKTVVHDVENTESTSSRKWWKFWKRS